MDMERFTTLAQQAITQALSIATSFKHAELMPLHILCALIEDASGTTRSLIKRGGGDPVRVAELATAQLHKMPTVTYNQYYDINLQDSWRITRPVRHCIYRRNARRTHT